MVQYEITSTFSPAARAFVSTIETAIVLVDGSELASTRTRDPAPTVQPGTGDQGELRAPRLHTAMVDASECPGYERRQGLTGLPFSQRARHQPVPQLWKAPSGRGLGVLATFLFALPVVGAPVFIPAARYSALTHSLGFMLHWTDLVAVWPALLLISTARLWPRRLFTQMRQWEASVACLLSGFSAWMAPS